MPRRSRNHLDAAPKAEPVSTEIQTVRCAIYTRKSTSEGLDSAFNSLDAQREAAEAYIASQKHMGWTVIPNRYDDGGFSGGSTERPGLQQLLDDIEAGTIDCVVVYKVDRLSRSLLDFARIMKLFEDKNIHFVSVTQHFNTAESMGRLTLNILLSFAQFEREIIGERIRDKIAASRKRGKWPGGNLLLGYDLDRENRRLLVNEDEAEQVRDIFNLYLEHESLLPVVEILRQRGWKTKSWIDRNGKRQGGREFDRWNLYLLLNNVGYLGKVRHKEDIYEGEHDAIIAPGTFEGARKMMERNRRNRGKFSRNKYGALLYGILRCGHCDRAMIHCPTQKDGRRYRYYVCIRTQTAGKNACPTGWINAPRLEKEVLDRLQEITGRIEDPEVGSVATSISPQRAETLTPKALAKRLRQIVERVEYDHERKTIRLLIRSNDEDAHTNDTKISAFESGDSIETTLGCQANHAGV
ncbi:MAG TPA: recombinase family protein [Phycisphaerae bacterium]|nr:recombinase family protein [Phycisphaerae bacterium]HRW52886.1 recombinase family protein [Phycisphaerae bacterium]